MRIKFILSLIVVLSVVFYLSGSAFCDDHQSRLSAALRYSEVFSMSEMLDETFENMAQRIPDGEREQFLSVMKTLVDIDKIEKATVETMAKHFTTDELNALANFYGSPVGKSIMEKFGPYMADINIIIMKDISVAVKKYQNTHRPKE